MDMLGLSFILSGFLNCFIRLEKLLLNSSLGLLRLQYTIVKGPLVSLELS